MSETITNCGASRQHEVVPGQVGDRLSVEEIARRLEVGRMAVYTMLEQGILPGIRRRIQFPADVAVARGLRALMNPPKVVWTIHSANGRQTDVAYLFLDLSQAGDAQYNRGGAARDSVIRVFDVGLTRARETLYICQRETGMAVTI
jgi:excisionase family DNA binding protein